MLTVSEIACILALANAPAKLRRACAAYDSATGLPRAASFSRLLAVSVEHL